MSNRALPHGETVGERAQKHFCKCLNRDYRAGYGIVAGGELTEEGPFQSQAIFAEQGEYHRRIVNLRVLPPNEPLAAGKILENSGYAVPARHIICKIGNSAAAEFLTEYLDTHGDLHTAEPTADAKDCGLSQGAGFGDAAENKLVEQAAIRFVTNAYENVGWKVRSVECDKCGFDLKCSKARLVEDVEVKGVRGDEQSFVITAGEVEQARRNPNFVVAVVTAALSASPTLTKHSGTEFCRRFDLSAIQYRAILRE